MHEINYHTFNSTVSKNEISSMMNTYAIENSDSHGPLYSPIKFETNVVYDSYDKAREYLDKSCSSYENKAVYYFEYPEPKKSAKMVKLARQTQEVLNSLKALKETNHFKNVKAAFISCPHCESKINRKIYITHWTAVRPNYCPVCRESMLKTTMLNKIANLEAKLRKLEEEYNAEYEIQAKKTQPTKKWMCRTEIHV